MALAVPARSAHAQVDPGDRAELEEAIVLLYDAPADCPSESEFVRAIDRDGGRFSRRAPGALVREFRVVLARPGAVVGRLAVRDGVSTDVVRTIQGDRCADVAGALAVAVALALEPERARTPSTPDGASPAASPSARPQSPELSFAESSARREASPETSAPEPEPLPPGWRLGVSGEGTASGLGSVAVGLAAYLEVIRDVPEGFAPALRLGVETLSGSGGAAVEQGGQVYGAANLSRRVLRADACPLRWVAARPWSASTFELWGCARFDAGLVSVVDPHLPASANSQRPWVAAGATAHMRWVSRRLFFYLEGGGMFPLVRERFVVRPSWTVYEIPVATGEGGLGVGIFLL
jgi:hypothetical protein